MNIVTRNLLKIMLERASRKNIERYPQMVCFAHDAISRKIFIDGLFEKRELNVLQDFLKKELRTFDTCLDIGANIGNHSLFFSNFFNQVISFEPNNSTFKVLEINGALASNIHAINVGLGSKSAILDAFVNPLNIGGAAISDSSEANIEFKIITLDTYLKENPTSSISFIKIDVEGHELETLKGASQTLQKYYPILALELHAKKERSQSDSILSFLQEKGYKYVHIFKSNFFTISKPVFVKISLNKFKGLPKKNHKMVLFTVN